MLKPEVIEELNNMKVFVYGHEHKASDIINQLVEAGMDDNLNEDSYTFLELMESAGMDLAQCGQLEISDV